MTADRGRCGNAAPTFIADTPELCCLLAGHTGWHRSDQGGEWNDIRRPADTGAVDTGRAGDRERAAELARSMPPWEIKGSFAHNVDLLVAYEAAAEQRGAERVAQRMRELHQRGPYGDCTSCCKAWPCPTIRAALAEVAPPTPSRAMCPAPAPHEKETTDDR